MNNALILYSTADCHLCEQAAALLAGLNQPATVVDIAERPELVERYGVRIPVLADPAGGELDWPFDAAAILEFIAQPG